MRIPGFNRALSLLLVILSLVTLLCGCGGENKLSGDFEIHFIDVGQADAALVLCDGRAMLIDGGNVADSGLIYTYLKKYGVGHLDYVIATHPHEDHIGGLAGAINFATVDTVYCSTDAYDSTAFEDFRKYVAKRNAKIEVPCAGDSFTLGGASVEIISCGGFEDENNSSIVLRIVYGETSFLFTGDAEREAEEAILERCANLDSTVLKVGHHGADTSTIYPFLREVMPEYAVISVGVGNDCGHPSDKITSRLSDAGATVYRTDLGGTIICRSDGVGVEFEVYKTAGETATHATEKVLETSPGATEVTYILNTNPSSKRFHKPTCKSVESIKEGNRKEFYGTRDEAIDLGYVPCGSCKP